MSNPTKVNSMNVHEAQPQDRPAIRDVARRSLQASYSLEPEAIAGAIEEWYGEDRLQEILDADDELLLVAESDQQTVGFSESSIREGGTAELRWLHVDPDYRAESYGEQLFEETREHLEDRGAPTIQGRVLADNPDGNAFYERQGLEKVGEEEVEIDGEPYVENVYAELEESGLEQLDVDGQSVYLDHNTTEQGSLAPFHVAYTDEAATDIYGYWCGNCERFANAMDSMGRIQCDSCGNDRKPSRWDAAYL